jgi:hypothetical protein
MGERKMTHEEFNKLYRSGAITVVEFYGEYDGDTKAVEAFEWNGKFYLRLHSVHPYTITRSCGKYGTKRYAMTKERHVIKEFDTKERANNYYRKFVGNFKMKRI